MNRRSEGSGAGSPWSRFLGADIMPRIGVILVGVPLLIWFTLRGGVLFLLLTDLVIFCGLREFYLLMEARGYRPYKYIGILCALLLSWYVYSGGAALSLLLTVILLVVMTSELFRRDMANSLVHISVTVFGVLYVGWLASHLVLLRELPNAVEGLGYSYGTRCLGLVAAVTWANDTVAYLVGVAIGSRPLLPRISPKKSVEGAIGGLVGAAAAGWLSALTFAGFLAPLEGALLGAFGGILAQVGDMVESLLKRDAGIKDSARMLPGHGGVLDRFDSLLFTAPVFYYYLRFFIS